MNTKLTLRIDQQLIKAAKEYSARTGKSVSRIVADLFEILNSDKIQKENQSTPTVSSLRGVLKSANIDEADYKKYLEDKHL